MSKPADGEMKQFSFGTCMFERTSPSRDKITGDTPVINVIIGFDEALKLNLAVDECIRKLNRYKKSTTVGKRAAMNLTILLDQGRVSVNETALKK
jgi:hypothetical protein